MSETVFRELLEESLRREFAEFDNTPEHKFSLRHRLAMRQIFARYEKNVYGLRESESVKAYPTSERKPYRSLKQRLIVAVLVIILMAFLAGWVVVFVSEKFHGTVYRDNTLLNAIDIENCPQTIEYTYALAFVPEGFELIETDSSPIEAYTLYKNKDTNQTITLSQCVKSHYAAHLNTERHDLIEVDINGKTGLCLDLSDEVSDFSIVVWDNVDYIIEISANLNKIETLNLCNVTKMEKNK